VFCRNCGLVAFPNNFGADYRQISQEERDRWVKEQIAREEARRRSAERAICFLRDNCIWEKYHQQLDKSSRSLWSLRGIPDSLQDFWMLGYDGDHKFWAKGEEHSSPTLTIPLFDYGWQPMNVKHRLLNPVTDKDKYRPEVSGITQGLFLTDPDTEVGGQTLVVEGEIKSMVVATTLGSQLGNVVGMPGKTPGKRVVEQLSQSDSIVIVADPDGREATWELCKAIGRKKCRVLIPDERMGKIDDWINKYHPSSDELRWIIMQGAKPAWV
jgi:hypothetical protein